MAPAHRLRHHTGAWRLRRGSDHARQTYPSGHPGKILLDQSILSDLQLRRWMHRATRAWLCPSPRQEYSMPFPRRAVRRAALGDAIAVRRAAPGHGTATPRRAVRRGALAGAAVLALALLAAACGSGTSSSAGSASSAAAGATGTVNWEWQLPTSWDPVTSSAGWDVH